MGTLSEDPDKVKCVYWDNLTYSPPGADLWDEWDSKKATALYESYLSHCAEAEQMGFAGVSMPEHVGPYSICAHPNVMMAALAQRTKTVRIVSGVNIPLWHNPIDLASEMAMVDVLSNGRVEIGLGRHGDQEANQNAIDLIKGVLHGEDYPLPARQAMGIFAERLAPDAPTRNTVWPRPNQKRLPLWSAAGSLDSVVAAASRGLGLMTGLSTNPQAGGMSAGSIGKLMPLFEKYIEVGQEHGHNLSMANVAVISFVTVAKTDEEAADRARAGFLNHLEKAIATYERVGSAIQLPADNIKAMFEKSTDSFLDSPFAMVGSVATVQEKLAALRAAGLSRFILPFGMGLDHQEAWDMTCLFKEEVAPELFSDPSAKVSSQAMS